MGYLYRFLTPAHEYRPQWQELRRRRRHFLASCLLFMPSVAVATLLTWPLRSLIGDGLSEFAALLLAAIIPIWLYGRVLRWPCPHCGRSFIGSWRRVPLINDHCGHCELPKYAAGDPARQTWEADSHA